MAITRADFPLPDVTDPATAGYFEGAADGELRIPRCRSCGRWVWYPEATCPTCGGALTWTATSGRGALFSWVVIHRSQTPGFETEVPYTVALVALSSAEGVRMVGNLVDCPPDRVKAGLALEAVFTPTADGTVKLVNWRPADASR